ERCAAFNLANHRELGYDFPDFGRKDGEQNSSADSVLAAFCASKFDERYPPDRTDADLRAKAQHQLADELQLVKKHKLDGFFLIYRDLQEQATEVAKRVRGVGTIRGGSGLPPGRGRGSSVSSIICYLIGLSHVDPVKYELFFRRFLNEDLQAVPDIDLDFARDIRERLILRVYERYGHDHAALVCSFATYRLRSAVRDLGKALGLPAAALDKQARHKPVDLGAIRYDDPAVYDAICRGDTVGLFQIESRAQIQMLPRTRPRTLDDLAVQVAIVRPGPIVGGAVNPYVRRRELLRRNPAYRPRADHPMLDELLHDTLGVVLYQDQVLEVAMKLG